MEMNINYKPHLKYILHTQEGICFKLSKQNLFPVFEQGLGLIGKTPIIHDVDI